MDQRTSEEVRVGQAKDGLYRLELKEEKCQTEVNSCIKVSLDDWHGRFGHTNENSTRKVINLYQIHVANKRFFKCKSCVLSKTQRFPYSNTHSSASSPLDLIYADI